ncbi:hypothetical protein DOTSEDRAFT_135784, partial [Dothistroma septosporum NZE10]
GIYGVQALRTYLDIHPSAKVLALEADDGAGGVWSKHRFYDGFWTQVSFGCCEFSDRPMKQPRDEDIRYGLFNARYVHEYLESYLDDHVYGDQSLRDRVRCGLQVTSVSKIDGLWHVRGQPTNPRGTDRIFTAPKVIIASGNTSIPNVPDFPNHGFQGQTIHIKDYGKHASKLMSSSPKSIAVLGAGKSAADLAFTAAQSGHIVSWIVRKSGHGPGLFAVPQKLGPYQNPTDVMLSRLGGTLSPSHLQPYTWWMWFLHTTWLGQMLLMLIFRIAGENSWKHARWNSMENARKGYHLLKPDSDGFVLDAPVGFIQDPRFWPTIAEKVRVYREDIDNLGVNGIHLADADKTVIDCDVLLLGTGFKSQLPFLTENEHRRLGLSHTVIDDKKAALWDRLTEEADSDIVRRFPLLARRQASGEKQEATPMRLYNAIGPLDDRSIAFVGFISLVNNFLGAEWQALWATAWLDCSPLLKVSGPQRMEKIVAYDTQWSRRRYPYSSEVSGTTYDLECIPYGDRLMAELGLESHVRHLSWWDYWTSVNCQRRYAGLVPEYKANLAAKISSG